MSEQEMNKELELVMTEFAKLSPEGKEKALQLIRELIEKPQEQKGEH